MGLDRLRSSSGRFGGPHYGDRRVHESLAEPLSLPDDYQMVLGNGGTTAFWEIATGGRCSVNPGATLLAPGVVSMGGRSAG